MSNCFLLITHYSLHNHLFALQHYHQFLHIAHRQVVAGRDDERRHDVAQRIEIETLQRAIAQQNSFMSDAQHAVDEEDVGLDAAATRSQRVVERPLVGVVVVRMATRGWRRCTTSGEEGEPYQQEYVGGSQAWSSVAVLPAQEKTEIQSRRDWDANRERRHSRQIGRAHV